MCCGETLYATGGGHLKCGHIGCPNPTALDEILAEPENEHIVEFGEETFTVQHPLRERIGGQLMRCELHQWIADLPGPPVRPGRYRALADPRRRWRFVRLQTP
jgi:hypothetical protein